MPTNPNSKRGAEAPLLAAPTPRGPQARCYRITVSEPRTPQLRGDRRKVELVLPHPHRGLLAGIQGQALRPLHMGGDEHRLAKLPALAVGLLAPVAGHDPPLGPLDGVGLAGGR